MAAIYRRYRHAEWTSQASTQGCNTLQLTYAHSHRGSAYIVRLLMWSVSILQVPLSATIAVGCGLLMLNVLVFVAIYRQRRRVAASLREARKRVKKNCQDLELFRNVDNASDVTSKVSMGHDGETDSNSSLSSAYSSVKLSTLDQLQRREHLQNSYAKSTLDYNKHKLDLHHSNSHQQQLDTHMCLSFQRQHTQPSEIQTLQCQTLDVSRPRHVKPSIVLLPPAVEQTPNDTGLVLYATIPFRRSPRVPLGAGTTVNHLVEHHEDNSESGNHNSRFEPELEIINGDPESPSTLV